MLAVMSFKTKASKVAPPPPTPAPALAPVATPQTDRQRRLSKGGRQSTFLGGLGTVALAGPKPSLTGQAGG